MEAELQQTLDELCDDLLLSDAATACDQESILQSLTLLALQFPQAQRILGRSLVSRYNANVDDDAPLASPAARRRRTNRELLTKLSMLTKRFLYRRETALSTIALLAALAHGSPFNQQRIVRCVTGVRLTRSTIEDPAESIRATVFDAGKIKKETKKKNSQVLVLYALTVPDSVKSAFRKWRKRQKLLQNHRIPSGAPPEQGGIPKPCHCNECLGAEQFLPTWQLHFQDLGRWRKEPDSDTEALLSTNQSCSLTSDAFFQVFLQDFRLCLHDPVVQNEENGGDKKRLKVFYFIPVADTEPEASASFSSTTPPPAFEPLQHVSAIEIAPEIDVQESAQALVKSRSDLVLSPSQEPSTSLEGSTAAYKAVSRVVLLEGRVELRACSHERFPEADASLDGDDPTTSIAAATEERGVAQFLAQIEKEAAGRPVTKDKLESALIDNEYNPDAHGNDDETPRSPVFLSQLDYKIFNWVLEFLESDDVVSLQILRSIMAQPRESSSAPSGQEALKPQRDAMITDSDTEAAEQLTVPKAEAQATSSFSFQITASVDTRELVVKCTSEDLDPEEERSSQVFSASILLEVLFPEDDTTPSAFSDPLSLLCIDESELRAILTRYQVCFCTGPPSSPPHVLCSSIDYLRAQQPPPQSQQDVDAFDDDRDTEEETLAERDRATKKPSSSSAPIPGLPDGVAKSLLEKLEALVLSFNNSSSSENTKAAFTAKFTEKLSVTIKSCNARITILATSRDIDGCLTSEVHRKAGMERCRQCRDLLIQLGKKVKLVLESSTRTAKTTASDALITADQLTRISKLVRKSVAQMQTQSQSVHAWETPDIRVGKLHLSRHVWSSGVPDPEFYRERDEQQRENKKKQRQLTQQLMGKHNKQQTAEDI